MCHPTKEHLELKPLETVTMRPLMMAWVPLPPKTCACVGLLTVSNDEAFDDGGFGDVRCGH